MFNCVGPKPIEWFITLGFECKSPLLSFSGFGSASRRRIEPSKLFHLRHTFYNVRAHNRIVNLFKDRSIVFFYCSSSSSSYCCRTHFLELDRIDISIRISAFWQQQQKRLLRRATSTLPFLPAIDQLIKFICGTAAGAVKEVEGITVGKYFTNAIISKGQFKNSKSNSSCLSLRKSWAAAAQSEILRKKMRNPFQALLRCFC